MARPVFEQQKAIVRPDIRHVVRAPAAPVLPVQPSSIGDRAIPVAVESIGVPALLDVFADAEQAGRAAVHTYKLMETLGDRAPADMQASWMQSAALTLSRMSDAMNLLRAELEVASDGGADVQDQYPRERMSC